MTKKSAKTEDLPGMTGNGVAAISIPAVEKAIAKYEKKKEARCEASPGEIAAKAEVQALLHEHREQLPKNPEGLRFYRHEERDYILEEKLRVRKVDDGSEES